jgi:LPXTG-motif cell wall-anchored protein
MAVEAGGSMDCDSNVTVHVTNNTTGPFHGQSSTVSAWIVQVDLQPGESADYHARFKTQTKVDGYVRGNSVEGYVNVAWVAVRPATCEVPTTTTTAPVDTTPQPIPTSAPGDVQMCRVPGANPPMQVPCDDPRATTPYVPPTPPTTPPVASTEPESTTTTPEPINGPVHVVQGPPKTHATTTVAKELPSTGSYTAPELGLVGVLLVIGTALVTVTRRRARA